MAAVSVVKKELRQKVQSLLKTLPQESATAQSTIVTNKLFTLPEYLNAKRISVFLSMPYGEISTTRIVQDALARGKEVFIPYTHNISIQPRVSIMDMLRLESMEEFTSLEPDKWGIPSLAKSSIPTKQNCFGGLGVAVNRSRGGALDDVGLDLIIMPGMAFDTGLKRLGHGKGYYDHFLNRYSTEIEGSSRAGKRPFLVALALKEQIIFPPEEVPVASHDQPVDAVIVGDGSLIAS
ncbi:putative 5-formyltetrahydrofolate cyclo-ligase [Talaromyces proteolyticus]|uniref:5-formyltetrahydrofolate cyclo-ligase n=1 Tax=Talaromyces proteolyticus TaxID=1131652 RepID=A0AAD4KHR8_9EURO|nr:putative 5-formyltetrahydrofolate cyclo-ligase [Talaromyces proteolyticus]KAH8691487.1 putative 5-formyltetrahydrofolate cyclo-ligase [Talaromyces proteolyticus]